LIRRDFSAKMCKVIRACKKCLIFKGTFSRKKFVRLSLLTIV
jgi:hypothetical protein